MKLPNLSKLPYYNTPASVEKTEQEIARLLKKYAIENYRWSTMGQEKLLEFIHQPVKNEPKLLIQIPVPSIKALYNRQEVEVPLKQKMRMLLVFLKALLEATAFGLYKLEQVFFGFTAVQLPNGSKISTKEIVQRYQDGAKLLSEHVEP